MAGILALRKALRVLASNYNAGSEWPSENENLYFRNLADISDIDLIQGVETWIKKQPRLPNLARLRATIEASPIRRKVADPLGCPACDNTGQREVARWYQKPDDRERSEVRAAACDCERGQRFAAGAFIPWGRVVDSWRSDIITTTTNDGEPAVFWTDAKKPRLPSRERMTPDEFTAWQERAEANAKKPKPTSGSWRSFPKPRKA